jgi:hypothetical protein
MKLITQLKLIGLTLFLAISGQTFGAAADAAELYRITTMLATDVAAHGFARSMGCDLTRDINETPKTVPEEGLVIELHQKNRTDFSQSDRHVIGAAEEFNAGLEFTHYYRVSLPEVDRLVYFIVAKSSDDTFYAMSSFSTTIYWHLTLEKMQ